jgi:hypothetical protein
LSFQRDTCQIYCCSLNEHTSDQERQRKSFDYFFSFKPLFFPFQNSRIS